MLRVHTRRVSWICECGDTRKEGFEKGGHAENVVDWYIEIKSRPRFNVRPIYMESCRPIFNMQVLTGLISRLARMNPYFPPRNNDMSGFCI